MPLPRLVRHKMFSMPNAARSALVHEMEKALKNERVGSLMCHPQLEAISEATAAESEHHKFSFC